MSRVNPERRLRERVPLDGLPSVLAAEGRGRHRVQLVDGTVDGLSFVAPSIDVESGESIEIDLAGRQRLRFLRAWRRRRSRRGGAGTARGVLFRKDATRGVWVVRFVDIAAREYVDDFLRTRMRPPDTAGSAMAPVDQAFQALGTALAPVPKASRVIVVTSARDGEGKSFVAAGLAASLARLGRAVTVVDAATADPVQHLLLGGPGTPGLAQAMEQRDAPLGDFLQRTASEVVLLPAGRAEVCAQLASAPDVADLVVRLRGLESDCVIVDAPALLAGGEAIALGREADDVLVVVRAGHSQQRAVTRALELARQQGLPVRGVVFNDGSEPLLVSGAGPSDPRSVTTSAPEVRRAPAAPATLRA